MITVEELIEQLKKYPPYYRVGVQQAATRYIEYTQESTDSGERFVQLVTGRGQS